MQAVPFGASDTPARDSERALKTSLEAALREAPDEAGARGLYFDLLQRLARTRTGLLTAWLPEVPTPLFLRCGTSDASSLHEVFGQGKYGFTPNHAPARILDLGAYVGYAAVYLANRFPGARIVCVEPVPANHRILLLNTLPYRDVVALNAAVWRSTGRLARTGVVSDRSSILAQTAESGLGTFSCYAVPDILRMQGWDRADYVKCSIEGAEKVVFADPGQDWIGGIDALAIETHDRPAPGWSAVAACFDAAQYRHARHGAVDVYVREVPRAVPPEARTILLAQATPELWTLKLENVASAPWGFFLFDERGLQLHPNAPNQLAARAIFTPRCAGQTRFSTELLLAGPPCEDVLFRVTIRRVADGAALLEAAQRVRHGAPVTWAERTPLLVGPHEVTLQTEMAPGTSSNGHAWARWIEPRLD